MHRNQPLEKSWCCETEHRYQTNSLNRFTYTKIEHRTYELSSATLPPLSHDLVNQRVSGKTPKPTTKTSQISDSASSGQDCELAQRELSVMTCYGFTFKFQPYRDNRVTDLVNCSGSEFAELCSAQSGSAGSAPQRLGESSKRGRHL